MAISVHKLFSPKAKLHACNDLFLMLFSVFKAEACLQCASELLQGVMGCWIRGWKLNFHSGHGLDKQLDGFHKSALLPTTFAEFAHQT